MGLTEDQLPGKTSFDADYHEIIQKRIHKAIEEGDVAPIIEAKYLKLDGSILEGEVQGARIVFDGVPALQASIYDMSERKSADQELKRLNTSLILATRAGRVGVWEFNIVNNHVIWDDQMFVLYGVDKRKFKSPFEVWIKGVHPKDIAECNVQIDKALRGDKEYDIEFRVIWPGGTMHNVRALADVQPDNEGNPLLMTGTNWDITEQNRAEEEMIDNLFELDSHTGRKGTDGELSTGLGLIICTDFVEKNRGKIWVESEVGLGSIFRFTLLSSKL